MAPSRLNVFPIPLSAIVMEGYDLVMINSFYAQPQFNEKFGQLNADGTYGLTAAWQTGLSNAVQVGSIIGLMMNGYLTDRFGYRRTMLGALAFMVCFIFITFFAKNITMLLIGELLCGLPWGIFQTLTVAFASEICPVAMRPYLTTYVNLCWVMGESTVRILQGITLNMGKQDNSLPPVSSVAS